jgi:HEXXH motif-containing protein
MLIADLSELTESCLLQVCRDHVFQNGLDAIRLTTIDACEGRSPLDCARISRFIALTRLAIALLVKTDSALSLRSLAGTRALVPAVGVRIDIPRSEEVVGSDWQCVVKGGRVFLGTTELPQALYTRSGCIKVVDNDLDFFWDRSNAMHGISLDGAIDAEKWTQSLENARALVATTVAGQHLVERFVSYLVPLRQGSGDTNLSFSARNFPAVVFKNHESEPHMVGETLIHEADHQFFYATERFERFFLTDPPNMKAVHFSPWRDDARPLDGIVRGLSAFARVSEYYSSALDSGAINARRREAIEALLTTRLVEAEQAQITASGSEELSEFGKSYLREVGEVLQRVKRIAATLTGYELWRARVESIIGLRRRIFLEKFRSDSGLEQGKIQ